MPNATPHALPALSATPGDVPRLSAAVASGARAASPRTVEGHLRNTALAI